MADENKALENQLATLQGELKTYFEKAEAESKERGAVLVETKTAMEALQKQVDAIDKQLTDRQVGSPQAKSLEDELKENDNVQRMIRGERKGCVINLKGQQVSDILNRKTTITSSAVGVATTGVLQIDRIAGITLEARQVLRVRDLLVARPTTMQLIDFVRVATAMSIASPQTEASDKAQNTVTFESKSEAVRTLATWIPASRQIMDDFSELANFLNTTMPYYVNLEEELQLLKGVGTGTDLDGLITQALAYDTSLTPAAPGWNRIDIIGRAIQQITARKEVQPTFVVMHPNDYWNMRLTKDSYGRYLLGDPQVRGDFFLFGLSCVPTTSIASGTFLVGSGNGECAEIRDRMEMQIEISTEHSDYFIKNLVAVRAEKRLALIVKRPNSFIQGTFTTSP